MLSLVRSSSPLVQGLESTVADAEKWSAKEASKIADLLGNRDHVITAHIGDGYAAASSEVFYWFTRVIAPQIRIEKVSAESILYHILAYTIEDAKPTLVVFSEEGGENIIARLADASKLMDTELLIVSPPLPPMVSARFAEGTTYVEIPSTRPSLYQLFLAASMAYQLARRHAFSDKRLQRLRGEIDNYTPILDDLLKKYSNLINELAELASKVQAITIAYTPTMKPVAHMFIDVLRKKQINVNYKPTSAVIIDLIKGHKPESIILAYTDVEEDVVRELKFKISMLMPSRKPKIVEFRLKTDPLTAPIYAVIVVEAVRDKLQEKKKI